MFSELSSSSSSSPLFGYSPVPAAPFTDLDFSEEAFFSIAKTAVVEEDAVLSSLFSRSKERHTGFIRTML